MNAFYGMELSENFTGWESRCRGHEREQPCSCHGAVNADPDLVLILQTLRSDVGKPVYSTCWFRCVDWNEHIDGHPGSEHLWGGAADISSAEIIADLQGWAEKIAGYMVHILPPEKGNVLYYVNRNFIHVGVGKTHAGSRIRMKDDMPKARGW